MIRKDVDLIPAEDKIDFAEELFECIVKYYVDINIGLYYTVSGLNANDLHLK